MFRKPNHSSRPAGRPMLSAPSLGQQLLSQPVARRGHARARREAEIAMDSTKHKQAEETVRQIETELHSVMASISDYLWGADIAATGRFSYRYFSPVVEKITGRPPGFYLAGLEQWLSTIHPDDRPKMQEVIQRIRRGQSAREVEEYRVVRPDGTIGWVRDSVVVRRSADGSARLDGVGADITDRKRAEQVLRESEELFRSLSASSPLGIFLTDPEGRCIYINPRCRDILGLSLMESMGEGWTRTVHPEDRARLRTEWAVCVRADREFSHEFRIQTLDKIRWIHLQAARLLSDQGERKGHVATVEDITERKRTEEKLQDLSARLIRLQDIERRHIARELHDATGQNLAALSINLSKLQRSLQGVGAETDRLLLDTIHLAGQCAREVRTLSYLLHPPMLDELGLAPALRWLVDGFAERSGIGLQLEVAPELGRLPQETETALFRIVQESLTNVHRHSGSKTAVIRLRQDLFGLTLEVQDHGRGFLPLADSQEDGTSVVVGVGISGMHERVKQLGGKLDVESIEGKGTTVRVWFPLPTAAAEEPGKRSAQTQAKDPG